jgi:RimJ/RimL family protein N-acetyltransferase
MLLEEREYLPGGESRVVLETERLVLRRPSLADVKAIARLANDRRIAQNTAAIPHPFKVSDAEAFVQSTMKPSSEHAFAVTRNNEIIGMVSAGLRKLDVPEIGYWLGVPYWGQGYATEAVRAAIDFAFEEFDCGEIRAGARVINTASRRVLEKCGFQWTGVELLRVASLGGSVPADRFRLDRGVWSSLKQWRDARRS